MLEDGAMEGNINLMLRLVFTWRITRVKKDKWDGWIFFCWITIFVAFALSVLFIFKFGTFKAATGYGLYKTEFNWPLIFGGLLSLAFTTVMGVVIAMLRDVYKIAAAQYTPFPADGPGALVKDVAEDSAIAPYIGAGYYIVSVNGKAAGGPLSVKQGLLSLENKSAGHKIVVRSPGGDVRELVLDASVEDLKLSF